MLVWYLEASIDRVKSICEASFPSASLHLWKTSYAPTWDRLICYVFRGWNSSSFFSGIMPLYTIQCRLLTVLLVVSKRFLHRWVPCSFVPICHVSPLVIEVFEQEMMVLPASGKRVFNLSSITNGFLVGFSFSKNSLRSSRNLISFFLHPEVIDQYLANEVILKIDLDQLPKMQLHARPPPTCNWTPDHGWSRCREPVSEFCIYIYIYNIKIIA